MAVSRARRPRDRNRLETASAAMALTDADGVFVKANAAYSRLVGQPSADLEGKNLSDLVHPDDPRFALTPGGAHTVRFPKPDGSCVWALLTVVRNPPGCLLHQAQDVTAIKEQEVRLLESVELVEQRFGSLVEHSSDISGLIDDTGTISFVSPSVRALLGYQPGELEGTTGMQVVHPDDTARTLNTLNLVLKTPGAQAVVEVRAQHADSSWRDLEVLMTNLVDDRAMKGVVINCRDITEHNIADARIAYSGLHDPLTGLPNRILFLDRLSQTLTRATRHPTATAVMVLDIDRFKLINDSLGHDAGDILLQTIAQRIERVLRPSDTVARLGADEFAIQCSDLVDECDMLAIATRMGDAVRRPVKLGDGDLVVTASLGISVGGPGSEAETLLGDADAAMYKAKERGRDRFEVFDEGMRGRAAERLEQERDMRLALERSELKLVYQPEVRLDGSLVGVEALLRWHHPTLGTVSPLDFIPLAEETGLIVPIGAWVLAEALRQSADWASRLPGAPVVMSVNLSAVQFAQPDLCESVAAALKAAGVGPERLCLEITESVVMDDAERTITTLAALKKLGVRLAIDDFGTGYSSLAYLKRFPVDALKVDRAFVSGLGQDADDSAIVAAVISMAHSMGLMVVAEGVETTLQLAELRELGCDLAQGYHFARPGTPSDVEALLTDAARQEAAGNSITPDTILVVDDDPDVVELVQFHLRLDGFETLGAVGGVAGLEMARSAMPDCVVLDVMMPELHGNDVLRALREDPRTRRTMVVMLTAKSVSEDKVESLDAGADDYMTKPFDPVELSARVRAVLRRRRELSERTAEAVATADRIRRFSQPAPWADVL